VKNCFDTGAAMSGQTRGRCARDLDPASLADRRWLARRRAVKLYIGGEATGGSTHQASGVVGGGALALIGQGTWETVSRHVGLVPSKSRDSVQESRPYLVAVY
jgi:hypothetical protein